MSKTHKPNIAKLLKELDDIVAWFESGEADVQTAVDKYEQGLAALAALEEQLSEAKLKVKKLDKKFNS